MGGRVWGVGNLSRKAAMLRAAMQKEFIPKSEMPEP